MNRPPKRKNRLPSECYAMSDAAYYSLLKQDPLLEAGDIQLLLVLKSFGSKGATDRQLHQRVNERIISDAFRLMRSEGN